MNNSHRPNANQPERIDFRRFVILDSLGTLCLGLGLAKVFGNVDVIPEAFRSEHYGIALIILGAGLSIPTVASLLAQIRRRQENQSPQSRHKPD